MQAHARMHHIDHWPQCFFILWIWSQDDADDASCSFWWVLKQIHALRLVENVLVGPGKSIGLLRCQNLAWKVWTVIQLLDQQWSTRSSWYMLIHSASFCLLTFLSLPLSLISYCHSISHSFWRSFRGCMMMYCDAVFVRMCTASARPHRDIYVIDGSARSSHSNAFCTGLDVGFWRFSKTNRATLSIPTWAFGNKFCVLREVPTCLESWNVSYVFCGILPGGSRLCNCCIVEDFSDLGAFACFCLFPSCSLEALAVSGAFASSIHFCLWWVRRVQSGSPKYFKFVCVDSMSAIFKFILIIYTYIYHVYHSALYLIIS